LEVALGRGLNFVEILKRNPNGWMDGIDVSMMMVEKARKESPKQGSRIARSISVILGVTRLKMKCLMPS